ncbi:hypothetical protein [Acidiphilium sp.]|uniref:hypothetical protein n=1 Tax=Acidiphilium sp. TaxID=527 RepID=UPI00258DE429|nr:hypothetical protein [Acidiphilium sp.]
MLMFLARAMRITPLLPPTPETEVFQVMVDAILLELNDERTVQCGRYMMLETIAGLCEQHIIKLPAAAAR